MEASGVKNNLKTGNQYEIELDILPAHTATATTHERYIRHDFSMRRKMN